MGAQREMGAWSGLGTGRRGQTSWTGRGGTACIAPCTVRGDLTSRHDTGSFVSLGQHLAFAQIGYCKEVLSRYKLTTMAEMGGCSCRPCLSRSMLILVLAQAGLPRTTFALASTNVPMHPQCNGVLCSCLSANSDCLNQADSRLPMPPCCRTLRACAAHSCLIAAPEPVTTWLCCNATLAVPGPCTHTRPPCCWAAGQNPMLPRPEQQHPACILLLSALSPHAVSPAGPEGPGASPTTPWATAAAIRSGAAGTTTAAVGMWAVVMTGGPAAGMSEVTTIAAAVHMAGSTPGGTSANGMMRCGCSFT